MYISPHQRFEGAALMFEEVQEDHQKNISSVQDGYIRTFRRNIYDMRIAYADTYPIKANYHFKWKLYTALRRDTNQQVVVKIKTFKSNCPHPLLVYHATEAIVLDMLKTHPNIVKLYRTCLMTEFEDQSLIMEMERCEMSLHDLKESQKGIIHVHQMQTILTDVFKALDYLHNTTFVVHCDVKAVNILVKDGEIKLCDFDSAILLPTRDTFCTNTYEFPANINPSGYEAPELLLGLSFSTQVDIWALACTVIELFLNRSFLYDGTATAKLHMIHQFAGPLPQWMLSHDNPKSPYGRLQPPPLSLPSTNVQMHFPLLPPEIVPLLTKMLVPSPYDRLTAAAAPLDPFFMSKGTKPL